MYQGRFPDAEAAGDLVCAVVVSITMEQTARGCGRGYFRQWETPATTPSAPITRLTMRRTPRSGSPRVVGT